MVGFSPTAGTKNSVLSFSPPRVPHIAPSNMKSPPDGIFPTMPTPPSQFDSISVILVRTRNPGNVGSIARIMKNMGFRSLKLVAAEMPEDQECQMMAGRAFDLVEGARRFSSLSDAASGEHVLFATTSGRDRRERRETIGPREAARLILEYSVKNRVGLVFGPERSGLTDGQLARCQFRVSIPSNPEYPVLNISKAAAILLYEIAQLSPPHLRERREQVSIAERERFYEDLRKVLIAIGFLSLSNPDHVMNAIRGILDQPDLTQRDLRILRGIVGQMDWYVREGRLRPPEGILKP